LPSAFTDPVDRPLLDLVARFARTHGPFLTREVAARYGVDEPRTAGALSELASDGRVVLGEFRPGGVEREWCDAEVLRRIRRRSLAALRREVEPVEADALARFLPAWQGVGLPRRGIDGLVEALGVLQGAPIPASVLEADVLPARLDRYRPADLDALAASGDLVWVGAGAIGAGDGRVRLVFRDELGLLVPEPDADALPDGAVHDLLRSHLAERGASFWPQLQAAVAEAELDYDDRSLLAALWDLVWAGEVSNDTLAPLRAFVAGGAGKGRRKAAALPRAGRPRPGRLARQGPPAAAGRWSLVAPLRARVSPSEAALARAQQLLERHGVLTREAALAEGVEGGFAGVYPVLRAMEDKGSVRRGYFVSGLGAAQFALPGAVDRIRAEREPAATRRGALARVESRLPVERPTPHRPWTTTTGWPARGGTSTATRACPPGGRPSPSRTPAVGATTRTPTASTTRSISTPRSCPWCWRPPTRPSPTVPPCRGRCRRVARPGPPGPTWCWSTADRWPTSSEAAVR
jgi:ATP-dependent Lhr-like helicase